jgi:tetratricopeptide (TPR) repeat protein
MQDISPNVKELILRGLDAKKKGDSRGARECFQSARVAARRLKDVPGEANALLELAGIVVKFDNDLGAGRKLLNESLRLYTKAKFDRGRAYVMSNIGSVALREGEIAEAQKWFSQALDIFEREQDKYGRATTLHQIGLLQKRRGDWISAEKHWRQSLLLLEDLDNKYAVGQVLLSLADVSASFHHDPGRAKALLDKALSLFEELDLPQEAEKVRHNLALLQREEHQAIHETRQRTCID